MTCFISEDHGEATRWYRHIGICENCYNFYSGTELDEIIKGRR